MDFSTLLASQTFWTILLGVALFLPVRRLIWVLSVRTEERRQGAPTDDARRHALKRRATVTAVLLCFVFSVLYVQTMMGGPERP